MKQILIRDMAEGDVAEALQIERRSFSTPWSETSFLNEIRKPHALARVAVVDDRVVGYLCAGHVLDEGHILDIAVHPDFRMLGIATSLVKRITGELKTRGCRCVSLEVRASNEAAKSLYEGLGFRLIGTRKGYYRSPEEDAVIMMLEL